MRAFDQHPVLTFLPAIHPVHMALHRTDPAHWSILEPNRWEGSAILGLHTRQHFLLDLGHVQVSPDVVVRVFVWEGGWLFTHPTCLVSENLPLYNISSESGYVAKNLCACVTFREVSMDTTRSVRDAFFMDVQAALGRASGVWMLDVLGVQIYTALLRGQHGTVFFLKGFPESYLFHASGTDRNLSRVYSISGLTPSTDTLLNTYNSRPLLAVFQDYRLALGMATTLHIRLPDSAHVRAVWIRTLRALDLCRCLEDVLPDGARHIG